MMFFLAHRLNDMLSDKKALSEATYYGKNSKFQKAEDAIKEMKRCYSTESPKKISINETEFHKHREKLEDILADIFGFKNVYINRSVITNVMKLKSGKTGAFTMVTAMLMTDSANIIKGKYDANVDKIDDHHNGVRFKKESGISIIINIDNYLFINNELDELNFTEKEILAILLHEIGHQFYNNKNSMMMLNIVSVILNINNIMTYIVDQVSTALLVNVDAKILEQSKAGTKNISNTLDNLNYSIDKLFKHKLLDILGMANKFLQIGISVVLSPLALFSILLSVAALFIGLISKISPKGIYVELRKDQERFADSFAASFGYGEYLASALAKFPDYGTGDYAKMKYSSGNKDMFEIFESFEFVMMLPLAILIDMVDEHPRSESRVKHIIRYLDDCADSIDNPKLRAEYEKNIKEVKDYREKHKNDIKDTLRLEDKESLLFQKILDCKTVEKIEKTLYSTSYANLDIKE